MEEELSVLESIHRMLAALEAQKQDSVAALDAKKARHMHDLCSVFVRIMISDTWSQLFIMMLAILSCFFYQAK